MSLETRRVPKDWDHPKEIDSRYTAGFTYIPLSDNFNYWNGLYELEAAQWEKGLYRKDWLGKEADIWLPKEPWMTMSYDDYHRDGGRGFSPYDPKRYMPDWPEAERTHWQFYETVSSGTPVSPVMESAEALAQWLADNSTIHKKGKASYNYWLEAVTGGGVPHSFVIMRNKDCGFDFKTIVEATAY